MRTWRIPLRQKQLAAISASQLEVFQTQLNGALQPFLAKLQETMHSFEEKLEKDVPGRLQTSADKMVEALAARLQKEAEEATRLLPDTRAKEFEALLQTLADKSMADSEARLRNMAGDTLESASTQLKQRQEGVVQEAVESFRNKVAKMLSVFQTGSQDAG